MKIVCTIPARYKSSRFPGKPLSDLFGKPMIWWVYQKVKAANGIQEAYVATDSPIIENVCKDYEIPVVMTFKEHTTGVDRIAETAEKIHADYYLLVQGDEPLIETDLIEEMVDRIQKESKNDCVRTFRTPIKNPIDAVNSTIIKIVTDKADNVLFASRSPIPYPKAGIDFEYCESVGVYAYPRDILLKYSSLSKGELEKAEDHDFMRMLENGIKIKAYKRNTSTISVDTPKDLIRVKEIMEEQYGTNIEKQ